MADAEFSTSHVYREPDTGKIRVKGATKVDLLDEDSPPTATLDDTIEKINEIIELLTASGINPE